MPKSKSESIMERTSYEKTSRMQIGVIQYIHMLITVGQRGLSLNGQTYSFKGII